MGIPVKDPQWKTAAEPGTAPPTFDPHKFTRDLREATAYLKAAADNAQKNAGEGQWASLRDSVWRLSQSPHLVYEPIQLRHGRRDAVVSEAQ